MAFLTGLCRTQIKLLLAGGENLLDACRAGNGAVTYDALLTALIGAAAQDLAAAVSAHAITESQARAALEAQRTQIIALLMASHPLIKPPAAAGRSSNS
jgi:imidazolonepropionase-like amidohydrolase